MWPPVYYFVNLSRRKCQCVRSLQCDAPTTATVILPQISETKCITPWLRRVCRITRFIKSYIDASFTVYVYKNTVLRSWPQQYKTVKRNKLEFNIPTTYYGQAGQSSRRIQGIQWDWQYGNSYINCDNTFMHNYTVIGKVTEDNCLLM